MSKKLLSFLLSELTTLRLICLNPQCGMVVEMHINNLFNKDKLDRFHCKFCNAEFNPSGDETPPLGLFAQAIQKMRTDIVAKKFDLEFVLPDNSPSGAAATAKS